MSSCASAEAPSRCFGAASVMGGRVCLGREGEAGIRAPAGLREVLIGSHDVNLVAPTHAAGPIGRPERSRVIAAVGGAMSTYRLDKLFAPRSVALVGASPREG